MRGVDAAGFHEAECGRDSEIGEDGEGLDILYSMLVSTTLQSCMGMTYSCYSNTTECRSVVFCILLFRGVRLGFKREDDDLGQLIASDKLDIFHRTFSEQALEAPDRRRQSQEISQETLVWESIGGSRSRGGGCA